MIERHTAIRASLAKQGQKGTKTHAPGRKMNEENIPVSSKKQLQYRKRICSEEETRSTSLGDYSTVLMNLQIFTVVWVKLLSALQTRFGVAIYNLLKWHTKHTVNCCEGIYVKRR